MTPKLYPTTKNYLYNASLSSSFSGQLDGINFDQNLVSDKSGKIQHSPGSSSFQIKKSGLLQIQVFAQVCYNQVLLGEASLHIKHNGQFIPLAGSNLAFRNERESISGVAQLALQRLLHVEKDDLIEIVGSTSPGIEFSSEKSLDLSPSYSSVSLLLNLNVDHKKTKISKLFRYFLTRLKV